jgi:hypothetical protein
MQIMSPVNFPQSNCQFGPPEGFDESQVLTINAFKGKILGSNMDGSETVVVAWLPDKNDLAHLNEGKPVFLIVLGESLPCHRLSTEIKFA